MEFFIPVIISLAFSGGVMPLVIALAKKFEWYDKPNHRTIHTRLVPRLGGVGIFWGTLLGILVTGIVCFPLSLPLFQSLLVLMAFVLVHITGLADDFMEIRALVKFFIQIFTAALIIAAGYHIKVLVVPFTDVQVELGPIGPLVTFFWIVGITNAVNLIDGMDGLAGGVSGIAIAFLGIYFALSGEYFGAVLALSLLGGILAFLFFNFPPAKIFMGDSGSLILGFSIAVLPLLGGTKVSPFAVSFLLPITLILIPVADTLGAIVRRLRDKRPIFSPDKEHMHHKLLALGFSTRRILVMVYLVGVVLGVPLLLAAFKWTDPFVKLLILNIGPLLAILFLTGFFSWLHWEFDKKIRKNRVIP